MPGDAFGCYAKVSPWLERSILLGGSLGLGAVAAYFGAMTALAGAVGALGLLAAVWVFASPARYLPLYAFLLPFDVYLSTSVRVTSNQVLQLLCAASWGLTALLAIGSPRRVPSIVPSALRLFLLALTLFLALSLNWTVKLEPSVRLLVRLFAAMAMFGLVVTCVRSASDVRRIVTALCLGASGCAVYGWVQFLRGSYDAIYPLFSPFYQDPFTSRGGGFQVVATFANPNDLAGFGCVLLPLFWARAAQGRFLTRAGWTVAGLALAGVVALTFSKTSWLVLATLAALWLLARSGPSMKVLAAGSIGIVAGTVILVLEPVLSSLGRLFPNVRAASVDSRLDLWEAAVRVFLERPLYGFGLDSFGVASEGVRSATVEHLVRAHNLYLQYLVDVGVLGAVLFFITVGLIFSVGMRAYPRTLHDPSSRATLLALLIGGSSFWIFACVDTLLSNGVLNAYWLVFALIVTTSALSRDVRARAVGGASA